MATKKETAVCAHSGEAKFDPTIHITGDQFATLVGIDNRQLYVELRAEEGAPSRLFVTSIGRKRHTVFDRAAAQAWAQKRKDNAPVRNIAPPRDPSQRATSRPYMPSAQLRVNLARTAEVYTHRLVTPRGIGNGLDNGQGYRRFSV